MHRVGREVGLNEQMRSFFASDWSERLSNVVIVLALVNVSSSPKPACTDVSAWRVHLTNGKLKGF